MNNGLDITSLQALPLVQDWASLTGLPPADPERIKQGFVVLNSMASTGQAEKPTLRAVYEEATKV